MTLSTGMHHGEHDPSQAQRPHAALASFRLFDWTVHRARNTLTRDGETRQVEPRAMDVLVALCRQAGTVVSADELLQACWGSAVYGDNPVHKTIAQLRSALGDNTKDPIYIETIRKRGYRVIADVAPLDEPTSGSWDSGSPYRGLYAFGQADAAVFYGRTEATARLAAMVTSRVQAGNGLVLVLGPSGSGKTSLIQAGLVPALMRGTQPGIQVAASGILDLAELGEQSLLTGLAAVMLDWELDGRPVFGGVSAQNLAARLKQDGDNLRLGLAPTLAWPDLSSERRLLLFIDRFETVFANPAIGEEERNTLLAALDNLARSGRVVVLIACRNDFYPYLAESKVLMDAKSGGGHFDLPQPSRAEMALMIRLPARAAKLSFGIDPDTHARLDDVLSESVAHNPDALPLLQHTLQELYRLRSDSGELTFDALRHLGGVEGAIGQRAEEVVATLNPAQLAALPRILSMLVGVTDHDDTVTARRAQWSALLNEDERALVRAMVEARLFVSELIGDAPGFGVAHEALLRRWPRVTAWIEEHRYHLRIRSRIAELCARWTQEGRAEDLLLPEGRQLDEARKLLDDKLLPLSVDETALITASIRRSKRRGQLRAGVLATIVVLSLAMAGLGLSAIRARHLAEARRADAEGLMSFMLGDFADKLRPLGRLALLDSVSAKALQFLSNTEQDDLGPAALTQRAKALQVIAEVRVARGQTVEARVVLVAAQKILDRQFARDPKDGELIKQLGVNAFWQGQLQLKQNNWDEAERYFRAYQRYAKMRYDLDPTNVDAWIEESYAHTNLGLLAINRSQLDEAEREFDASIVLKMRALAAKPDDHNLSGQLANSLSWLAACNEMQGKLGQALSTYEREQGIFSKLNQASPNDFLWATRLASALQRSGKLRWIVGQREQAQAELAQAEKLFGLAVAREPDNHVWLGSLAIVRLDRLQTQGMSDDPVALLQSLRALSTTADSLVKQAPENFDWSRLRALTTQTIAVALLRLGHRDEARSQVTQAIAELDTMFGENPTDLRIRSDLAKSWLILSGIDEAAHDRTQQLRACGRARDLVVSVASASNDYRLLDPWVRAETCLGNDATVYAAINRLRLMGYQESTYMQFLSTESTHKD